MKIDGNANLKDNHGGLTFKSRFITFFKKYRFAALFGFLFSILLYSLMMSQQLTNTFDGLWQQNYHEAGALELTSGRWMLIFVDKLVMGLHAEPIASIAALSLYIAGFLLTLNLFKVENSFYGCLGLALFLSSTAICNTLSYRFTSLGYGFAYLLAVLSVYTVIKVTNPFAAVGVSGLLLGLSMSCYQAYLAVFCTIAVFYIIVQCKSAEEVNGERSMLHNLLRIGCSLITGAVFYIVSLSLMLKLFHSSLSGYNGIGEVSSGAVLAGLPQSILKTFQYFGAYFFMDKLKINRLQPFGVLCLLLALFILLIVLIGINVWKTKKQRIVLLLFAAFGIPIACSAYMLIAGDKMELQMTAGLAMFMSLTMIVAFSCFKEKRFLKSVCTILCIALIYGNSMQVWFDQEAMYEGQNACETMATQVISDLKSENLLSSDYEYYFIGAPAENPFFSVSSIYDCANGYAQMGRFWTSGNCCQMSYDGLINQHMGFNLSMSSLDYETVAEKISVQEMPEFPAEGYMTLLDDHTVVIKISEYKEYTGNSKYVFE